MRVELVGVWGMNVCDLIHYGSFCRCMNMRHGPAVEMEVESHKVFIEPKIGLR